MNDDKSNELDFNRKNRETYEQLMKESSVKNVGYWNRNNPIVKFILLVLGLFIIGGVLYYLVLYFR